MYVINVSVPLSLSPASFYLVLLFILGFQIIKERIIISLVSIIICSKDHT